MPSAFILTRLTLTDFRNYARPQARSGSGPRGADRSQWRRQDQSHRGHLAARRRAEACAARCSRISPATGRRRGWAIAADISSPEGETRLGTAMDARGRDAEPDPARGHRRGLAKESRHSSPIICGSSGSPPPWTGCSPGPLPSGAASSTGSSPPMTPNMAPRVARLRETHARAQPPARGAAPRQCLAFGPRSPDGGSRGGHCGGPAACRRRPCKTT